MLVPLLWIIDNCHSVMFCVGWKIAHEMGGRREGEESGHAVEHDERSATRVRGNMVATLCIFLFLIIDKQLKDKNFSLLFFKCVRSTVDKESTISK